MSVTFHPDQTELMADGIQIPGPVHGVQVLSAPPVLRGRHHPTISVLRTLFQWMSVDVSSLAPTYTNLDDVWSLSHIAFVGQPVDASDSHAMIRVSLRCKAMLSCREEWEGVLEEDLGVIRKMERLTRYFDVMPARDGQGGGGGVIRRWQRQKLKRNLEKILKR